MDQIADIVRRHVGEGEQAERLMLDLYRREDEVADTIREAGMLFGLHAPIVAEVLTNAVRLGTPVSEEARALVRQQFIEHINHLREQGEGGQP